MVDRRVLHGWRQVKADALESGCVRRTLADQGRDACRIGQVDYAGCACIGKRYRFDIFEHGRCYGASRYSKKLIVTGAAVKLVTRIQGLQGRGCQSAIKRVVACITGEFVRTSSERFGYRIQ